MCAFKYYYFYVCICVMRAMGVQVPLETKGAAGIELPNVGAGKIQCRDCGATCPAYLLLTTLSACVLS